VLSALSRGVDATLLTNISPKYVIRRALEAPDSVLYASPALLSVLVRLLPQGARLPRVMTSGAPLTNVALAELRQHTLGVLQQYGSSEVGCVSVNLDVQRACEVGHALGHVEVSAGRGSDALDEIVVRCEGRTTRTRDLGYMGERGLCFVSRVDDLINVAGTKVYPAEVEDVIGAYPGIGEAAVYRRADPYAGERVCLQFTAAHAIDIDELRTWCSEQLSPYQVPLEIRQVDQIPRLPNGKLSRRALAEPGLVSAEGAS
jgi:fatty-acyl-CoA synthase